MKSRLLPAVNRFEGAALLVIALLGGLISFELLWGRPAPLRVNYTNWQNKKIGAQDRILSLGFNQPIDGQGLSQLWKISPNLGGQLSWQGKRLFYSLTETPRYGVNYQIQLQPGLGAAPRELENFTSLASARNRSFFYIGTDGEERGRLILFDLTDPQKLQKTILTPKDLLVRQFQVYPQGDRVLFIASDPRERQPQLALFTVTTGVHHNKTQQSAEIPGRLERLLAEDGYDTLQIALAPRGERGALLRQNRQNPTDRGLWILEPDGSARPLGVKAEQFRLSPRGTQAAFRQGDGVGIAPLTPEGGGSQFWRGYERAMAFTPDGNGVLLTQINDDYTYSLVIKNSQTQETEAIFRSVYPVQTCEFDPIPPQDLYCLKTEMVNQGEGNFQEETFLIRIDRKTGKTQSLLALPNYPDAQLSLAPDGSALLLDQAAIAPPVGANDVLTPSQQAVTEARIWLLPLAELRQTQSTPRLAPQEVTAGFAPLWLP
ncbi:MAG: hypothetical protein VKN60_02090 [Cyanobacteriota bacterium]|nr:hypothetical protein [Cyanobacteriota bacterium]